MQYSSRSDDESQHGSDVVMQHPEPSMSYSTSSASEASADRRSLSCTRCDDGAYQQASFRLRQPGGVKRCDCLLPKAMRLLQAGNSIIQSRVRKPHTQEGLVSSGGQVMSSHGTDWAQLEVPLMQYRCWKNGSVS